MISGKRSQTFTAFCNQVGDLCAWSFPDQSLGGCGHCMIGTRSGFFLGLARKWRMTRPASTNIDAASIRNFPDQERLKQMLLDAGFRQVTYRNLSGGIVAIHVATK